MSIKEQFFGATQRLNKAFDAFHIFYLKHGIKFMSAAVLTQLYVLHRKFNSEGFPCVKEDIPAGDVAKFFMGSLLGIQAIELGNKGLHYAFDCLYSNSDDHPNSDDHLNPGVGPSDNQPHKKPKAS